MPEIPQQESPIPRKASVWILRKRKSSQAHAAVTCSLLHAGSCVVGECPDVGVMATGRGAPEAPLCSRRQTLQSGHLLERLGPGSRSVRKHLEIPDSQCAAFVLGLLAALCRRRSELAAEGFQPCYPRPHQDHLHRPRLLSTRGKTFPRGSWILGMLLFLKKTEDICKK